MKTAANDAESADLTTLAEQINESHQTAKKAMWSWLKHARDTGDLLIQAKQKVLAAGEKWLKWVEQNCEVSVAEAQRYMRIAANYDKLMGSSPNVTALSMREALNILSDSGGAGAGPKPPPVPKPLPVPKELLERARADGRMLKLKPNTKAGKFVEDTKYRIARDVVRLAAKGEITGPGGKAVEPAVAAVALIDHLRDALKEELVLVEDTRERAKPAQTAAKKAQGTPPAGGAKGKG